jgi:hypothetical protein
MAAVDMSELQRPAVLAGAEAVPANATQATSFRPYTNTGWFTEQILWKQLKYPPSAWSQRVSSPNSLVALCASD